MATIPDHQDHASDVDELRTAIKALFDNVQDWTQRTEEKRQTTEGLMELRDKAQKLLILVEKADQGMSAIAEASRKIELANRDTAGRLNTLDETARDIGTRLAAVELAAKQIGDSVATVTSATKHSVARFDALDSTMVNVVTRLGRVVSMTEARIIIGLLVAILASSVWSLLK